MSRQITARIPDDELSELDSAIARGRFSNRAAAVREGLELLLREEREREIENTYRRGYGKHPQESRVGEAGIAAFSALVAAEENHSEPL
jgi:Arc/MetJ-type ribon-helix-helix transcriptional regulator